MYISLGNVESRFDMMTLRIRKVQILFQGHTKFENSILKKEFFQIKICHNKNHVSDLIQE